MMIASSKLYLLQGVYASIVILVNFMVLLVQRLLNHKRLHYKWRNDLQPWQERRASEYVTRAPLSSVNLVGGVASEINAVYPR